MNLNSITAVEEYGKNGELLDELENLGQPYVMEVPTTTAVWTIDPASCVPGYSGRGQPPKRPTRESVCTLAELMAACLRGHGSG